MNQYDPKKIEELQLVLLKNPRSPVFASLSEAYRKMGLLEEALEVTTRGIKHNPEYISGLVAHAKILFELKDYRQTLKILSKVRLLKPENILALRLLGHSHIKLRQHREALRAFKQLLILIPNDESAIQFIKKWEFLDSLQPEAESQTIAIKDHLQWIQQLPSAQHVVNIIDSFISNDDSETAREVASAAIHHWPQSEELKQREQLLINDAIEGSSSDENSTSPLLETLQLKKEFYQRWLHRIERAKNIDPSYGN